MIGDLVRLHNCNLTKSLYNCWIVRLRYCNYIALSYYIIQDTRYKIQNTRYKIQDTGYRIQDTRSKIQFQTQDTNTLIQANCLRHIITLHTNTNVRDLF